jgi:hypothetical protein
MSLDADLVQLIDQRIRANSSREKASGTCSQRDLTGPGAQVTFDGSTVAMPVKVLGHVMLQPGDRCVLDKYGSDWIVTGSFSTYGLGFIDGLYFGPAVDETTTSATFVDLVAIAPLTFNKVYDYTHVRMRTTCSGSASVAGTGARYGLRFTPQDAGSSYTPVDYSTSFVWFSGTAQDLSTWAGFTNFAIPAGEYSVQMRWRRTSGTGILTADNSNEFMIEIAESLPPYVPVS